MSEQSNNLKIEQVQPATVEEYVAWSSQFRFGILRNFPHLAIRDGRADIIAYLREEKVDFSSELMDIAACNESGKLKTLLAGGVDPNTSWGRLCAINQAAKNNACETLRILIRNGANIDRYGDEHETPLMWAAYNGNINVAKILMDAGANPMLQKGGGPYGGNTAWMMALTRDHDHVCDVLMDYQSEWNQKTKQLGLPPPEKQQLALPAPKSECPPGWSIVNSGDVQMAIQTIKDADNSFLMRNVFDFSGKRLLTEFQGANGAPLLSDKRFDELDPQIIENARRVFTAAGQNKTGPGLI